MRCGVCRPGGPFILLFDQDGHPVVPTCALQSRRAQWRSRMPEGQRVAARSVLDGREHDGTLAADGRQRQLSGPSDRPARRGRASTASCHRPPATEKANIRRSDTASHRRQQEGRAVGTAGGEALAVTVASVAPGGGPGEDLISCGF